MQPVLVNTCIVMAFNQQIKHSYCWVTEHSQLYSLYGLALPHVQCTTWSVFTMHTVGPAGHKQSSGKSCLLLSVLTPTLPCPSHYGPHGQTWDPATQVNHCRSSSGRSNTGTSTWMDPHGRTLQPLLHCHLPVPLAMVYSSRPSLPAYMSRWTKPTKAFPASAL